MDSSDDRGAALASSRGLLAKLNAKGGSKDSTNRLAAVMERLPAQEPFRNTPSLSRSHDPGKVVRGK